MKRKEMERDARETASPRPLRRGRSASAQVQDDETQTQRAPGSKRQRGGGRSSPPVAAPGSPSSSSSPLSSPDSEEMPLLDLVNSNSNSNVNGNGVAVSSKGPAKSSLGSSRTVPEHQPGTPHADLHNEYENPAPEEIRNGNAAAPLDDVQLRDAIEAVRVKQEQQDDYDGTLPLASTDADKPVEQLVKGQAVDDEEITHDLKPRERPAQLEERLGVIRFVPVTSSQPSLTTSIILTGLKNIFQRQLPKMPREYITRLVFDRNHWSVAIVKKGYQVVGGITYRPFDRRAFGEIVFCAITGTEQVRGYGSHLMNHLKDWVKEAHPNVKHFLTYADNYAFGYFKKQGFTKEITLPRSVWAGYIKDYEGATIMQCTMLPRISYLDAAYMLLKQKQIILQKIRENSNSHIVHSGKDLFSGGRTRIDPRDVPALREIGWTPDMDALTRRPERGPQHAIMRRLLTDLQNHPASWAFARPVNGEEVTDYYEVIKEPMDLETMENKLNAGKYDLPTSEGDQNNQQQQAQPSGGSREALKLFLRDCQLIFDNCKQYNSTGSNYVRNADKLRAFLEDRVQAYTEG